MNVNGTVDFSHCVNSSGWIDLVQWTGRSYKSIPLKYREAGEGITHVSSMMPQIGDPHCDPSSGGIAGAGHMAAYYGVGEQQFKRNILPNLEYVRWLGNIPVSNVNSVYADGLAYQENVRRNNCANLVQYNSGIGGETDQSSGYI